LVLFLFGDAIFNVNLRRNTRKPHPEERSLERVSKDGHKRRCMHPSFETPRKCAAPQDEGQTQRRNAD
jgi:hypothetical protein